VRRRHRRAPTRRRALRRRMPLRHLAEPVGRPPCRPEQHR
jgi:hypothetical protein